MSAYEIDIFRLSNKEHQYEYQIGPDFFQAIDQDLVQTGSLIARVVLNKNDRFIELNLTLDGTVELVCDRSLDVFDFLIEDVNRVIFKYGDREEELSEEMVMITTNTQHINVGQLIFEFIAVAIPLKKLHPRFEDEEEDQAEQLVYRSDPEHNTEEDKTDPRWNALKGLKEGQ